MQLSNQAPAKGKFFEQRDAKFQCNHIVADLAQVFGTAFDHRSRPSGPRFSERGFCTLDPAGQEDRTASRLTKGRI
jgi:hypothetical protein